MTDVEYGHYTSLKGLLGIIGEAKLWCTNVRFLNDEHEFQHALDLIKNIIPQSKIPASDPTHGAMFQKYAESIIAKLGTLDQWTSDSVFTLSFSEQPDLLSQWRGYCPGNNGYCVVFDAQKLRDSLKSQFEQCHLVKCVYDIKEKELQLKKLLNENWHKYFKANGAHDQRSVLDELGKELVLLASYFKHESFLEEKEHRIVLISDIDAPDNKLLKFREGRFSLIPYLELDIPRSLIKKIYIGPTAHRVLAKRALEGLVERSFELSQLILDMKIEFSKTPYRPW